MLSRYYKIGDEDRARSWDELLDIGVRMKKGAQPSLSPTEIDEAGRYVAAAERLSGRKVLRDVIWWLVPIFVAAALLIFILM